MSRRMLLALLAASAAAQPPGLSRSQQAYERANTLFEQRKLPESLAALEEALRADPNNVPALTLKAKIAISANRLDIAGESLERAVAADPSSWYAHFLYGFWHYLRDDWAHAISELTTARKLNPKDTRSPLYLAMTHERLGDTARALAFYEEALRLEEAAGAPDPYTLLGYSRVLQSLGRLDDCTKILNRAIKLYPNSRAAQYELGRLLLKRGDPKGAAKAGEAALRLPADEDVTQVQIHYLLVRAYTAAGDDQLAAKHAAALRAVETPVLP